MKIALCQINQIVGNLPVNRDKIITYYKNSIKKGAEIIVFPELSITGYPPQDLLLEKSFIDENLLMLDEISSHVGPYPLIVGHVSLKEERLYNCASIIQNNQIVGQHNKILLPTYDIFDEFRYFTPGSNSTPQKVIVNNHQLSIGLEICEDLWDDGYNQNVTEELVKSGAEIIINISASPYSSGKLSYRENLIKDRVSRFSIPFLYCNIVGAQDELIFDGSSISFSKNCKIIARGNSFKEEIVMVDLDKKEEILKNIVSREEELFSALKLGISDYFRKTGHRKSIIGLSGGIDSALTACLATESLGKENVLCINMPSRYSSKHSMVDAEMLASNLGVSYKIITIEDLVLPFETIFEKEFNKFEKDITEENLQARIRGNLLMAFANKLGHLVLSTSNKTELALGYSTIYGDMVGGLAAISDLHKKDVFSLSRWYNKSKGATIIPERIFNKTPSAELAANQVDPFDYDIVSPLVEEIIENQRSKRVLIEMGYDPLLIEEIKNLIRRSEFKRRQAAPTLRVSSKAFGLGRRYPIINGYKN